MMPANGSGATLRHATYARAMHTTHLVRVVPMLLPLSLAAQTTWIVEAGNPAAQPTLAAAVAIANDGDMIRIRNVAEDVSGLTITKSLRIVGDASGTGAAVLLSSQAPSGAPLTITIGGGKALCVANCNLGFWLASNLSLHLTIRDCAGSVALQDSPYGSGVMVIQNSRQVLCSNISFDAQLPLQIAGSTVVFANSTMRGRGADYEFGTPSTAAASIAQSAVHCVDATIRGGAGRAYLGGIMPGSLSVTLIGSTLTGAGNTLIASGTLTSANAISASNSLLVLEPSLAPTVTATNTTVIHQPLPHVEVTNFASGQTATLALRTPNGSLSALLVGLPGARRSFAGVAGDFWLDPQVVCTPVLAIQNGSLAWTVAIPPTPALFATPIRWQGAMLDQGLAVLGAPGSALLR